MTSKAQIIDSAASSSGLSKGDAGKAIDAALDAIVASLASGQKVTIVGFGAFKVHDRKARKGRNPATGETIDIGAKRAIKFKPGKELEERLGATG